MESQTWLRCQIGCGQFNCEYAVRGELADGTQFSLFTDAESLEHDIEPSEGRSVDGWMKVEVLERRDNMVLVQLPRQTLENGRFVTVNQEQLRVAAPREPA